MAAGTWHLVGDGESITKTVEVRFDLIWKTAGGQSTVVGSVMHTFVPDAQPNIYASVMFDADVPAAAIPAGPGDQLILKFNTVGGDTGAGYTPNGDGVSAGARVPNLTLP